MKVRVFTDQVRGRPGYDLEIHDLKATVQDYIDAMNDFIEQTCDPCRGCDECCWERIPLTCIDVYTYLKNESIIAGLPKDLPPLLGFLKKYTYIYVENGIVDISLFFEELSGACSFLQQEQRICRLYQYRSLVCQTFICLESSSRAQELRSIIVNAGMDELVRQWLIFCRQIGLKPQPHEIHGSGPKLADYPPGPFNKTQSYRELLLVDLCPDRLWHKLYNNRPPVSVRK